MTITITAFEKSPDGGKGLARDTRVRWALEEVGQPYEVRLVSFRAMKEAAHLALHPFGQIPTYEEGDLLLFETGSIVLHIAERHAGLLPADPNARARAITWMFAALSTIEPPILALNSLGMKAPASDGVVPVRDQVAGRVDQRLDSLAAFLDGKQYLEGDFSAADLLMTTVLRVLRDTDRVASRPVLRDYQARCEARPAFRRALDAQMSTFAKHAPAAV